MKNKIDPLFALSVLVLVLGIFALACSWVPDMSQRSESNNFAKAETVSAGSISNTDFVIGTTTEAKYWRSATPLVNGGYYSSNVIGYMVKGLPKVSDFSALSSTSPFTYEVKISFSGLVNGLNATVTSNLTFTNNFLGQSVTAFQVDLTGSNDDLDMNIYTDHIFTGEMEGLAQFCNTSFASRFSVFDYPSAVTVSYTFKDSDVVVTSDTMTENFRQFLSIVNNCVAFSPVDFASYGDYLLNNQVDTNPDLPQKYEELKNNYDNLFNSVSFSRVISGFPVDSFYTTKHLDAVSYNGKLYEIHHPNSGFTVFADEGLDLMDYNSWIIKSSIDNRVYYCIEPETKLDGSSKGSHSMITGDKNIVNNESYGDVLGLAETVINKKHTPDTQSQGNTYTSDVIANSLHTILRQDEVSNIDNVATIYESIGYMVDKFVQGNPLVQNRKLYNYIECETIDVTLRNCINDTDTIDLIEERYQDGIRFWNVDFLRDNNINLELGDVCIYDNVENE